MLRTKRAWQGAAALLGASLVAIAAVTACSSGEAAPKNAVDASAPTLRSDLHGGQLTRVITLPGEKFKVRTTYSSPYAANSWNITDDKTLSISLRLVDPVPAGTTVYLEHMHADVTIVATTAAVNGLTQDSMDDSMHGGTDPGFLVTAGEAYTTIFSIEGYSQNLISGWSFQTSSYGSGEISDQRLTEDTLRDKGGATGNKITVIYDLLIKYSGDAGYHKVAVQDTLIVPVSKH